jgi:DNA-binding MarR family transcriptional regulator
MDLADLPRSVSLLAVAAFRLSRHLKANVTRVVSSDSGLGLVSWRVMVGLSERDGQTQRELVEFARTEQAQMSRILRGMEAVGLISSKTSATDRRARNFSLTPAGRQEYEAVLPRVTALSGAIDAALSAAEQEQFIEMCDRIEAAARNMEARLLQSGETG